MQYLLFFEEKLLSHLLDEEKQMEFWNGVTKMVTRYGNSNNLN